MSVRLNVLGPPSCYIGDRELVDLPAQKIRLALMAYLAVEGNVSRDSVAALFWPDSDTERARHALCQIIYELRRTLGNWLETRRGRLMIAPAVEVDITLFNSGLHQGNLEAAVSRYRGVFLQGFHLPNNPQFESWVDRQRGHLERAHRKARRELLNTFISNGKHVAAIELARQWVELDPLEDEANHRYIELLIRNGARADAFAVFAQYERLLKVELDVEPLNHTRQLIQQLREQAAVHSPPEPLPAISAARESDAIVKSGTPRKWYVQLHVAAITAIILPLMLVVLWLALQGNSAKWFTPRTAPIETRFAIFPFQHDYGAPDGLPEETLLREAFGRWSDVTVVDLFQAHEAFERLPPPVSGHQLTKLSRELGAGRYVRGRVSRAGDTLLVHAALYDAINQGRPLIDRTVHIPIDFTNAESAFAELAEVMVGRPAALTKARDQVPAAQSWPARTAFARALSALREWDLQRADREFAYAMQMDSTYTEAYLWFAQTRSWLRYDVSQWSFAASRAFANRGMLNERDRRLASALFFISRNDVAGACAQYRELTTRSPNDFAVWYGLGDCLQRDEVVEPDPNTSSGWRFRSSYHAAVIAYQRAFELLPSVHKALRAHRFQSVRSALKTYPTALRSGSRSGLGPYEFVAYPELAGDTLVFIPYRISDLNLRLQNVRAAAAAVRHQRRVFQQIAIHWVEAYPQSPEAREALAIAAELLADPSALDTLLTAAR